MLNTIRAIDQMTTEQKGSLAQRLGDLYTGMLIGAMVGITMGVVCNNIYHHHLREKTQEKIVRSYEEAVEIIRNKRGGQWLALANGTVINLETGETE